MSIKVSSLFPLPTAEISKKLDHYLNVLNKAMPLRSKHKTELPYAIRDLSRALTGERASLPKDYMAEPRSLNAYLRYFLPWNLYRMSRLFQGLDITLPDDGVIIDLGAGPLTVAQALWIARPELREKKLTFVNVDRTPKPMREATKLFEALAGENSPWRMINVKGGTTSKIREKADLLVTANMVNEASGGTRAPLPIWAEKFCTSISRMLAPKGRILIIEPGIRMSGRVLSVIRNEYIEKGFSILGPCTHHEECPMNGEQGKAWCHFNFDAENAPVWLQKLSANCRLEKSNVSLSFLYVAQPGTETQQPHEGEIRIRAISDSFRLDEGGFAQYGCAAEGQILLTAKDGAKTLYPGGLIGMPAPEEDIKDVKSGAMIVELPMRDQDQKRAPKTEDKSVGKRSGKSSYERRKPQQKNEG
ncbi:small ribosomal subunit Rsm22 family protein [Maridesulfovibrio zosterae]|uniref:small ribosomal subunit Rsm22 family protein n=1 Tax=Maridesulfovibrio zosterae TaxID=82171 RepID=UPI0003F4FE36|nr:small ribosomal subunit Rsm22 family protein [Maridesulfovibrio zosterae]